MPCWIKSITPFWWLFVVLGVTLLIVAAISEEPPSPDEPHVARLKRPTAVAVSRNGEIYVYDNYEHIRIFDTEGKQLRSWPVETHRGMAILSFDTEGNLEVASVRGRELLCYSAEGRLIHRSPSSNIVNNIDLEAIQAASSPEGGVYHLARGSLVYRGPDGSERTLVAPVRESPPLVAAERPVAFIALSVVAVGFILGAIHNRFPRAV